MRIPASQSVLHSLPYTIKILRWLRRVSDNTLPIECELEKETLLISLKVFPV